MVLRLRGKAAPPVRHKPCAHLLRAHPCQRHGNLIGWRTARRSAARGRLGEKAVGYLAYQSVKLGETLASGGISLVTERPRHHGARQQADVAFSTLKRIFGTYRTLAKTQVGLVTRIVAKVHTCATLLLGKGVRPKIVQELLGHATIVITLDT